VENKTHAQIRKIL